MAGQNQNEESQKEITNNGNAGIPVNQNEDEVIVEEYDMLDSRLDELNTALDFLEQKNDNIHDQLKALLQSNIEIRKEMEKEKADTSSKE